MEIYLTLYGLLLTFFMGVVLTFGFGRLATMQLALLTMNLNLNRAVDLVKGNYKISRHG